MADLMKTPGHADLLQDKNQEHAEKIIPERVFLLLSLPFEGMDILAGLIENLLETFAKMAIKTQYMVCQTTKRLTPKHIGEEEQVDLLKLPYWCIVTVSVMLSLFPSRGLCLACSVWLWFFLIILTNFCCFWSSFTPGKQIGKPGAAVQSRKSRYWNKASPWKWWCDCKIRFWQMCRKNWICVFPW